MKCLSAAAACVGNYLLLFNSILLDLNLPEELHTAGPPAWLPGVEIIILRDQDRIAASVVAGGVTGTAVYPSVVGT